MKREFCDELIDECGDEIDFGGPADYGGQSYCDFHVGGINGADEFWSYPYQDRECFLLCLLACVEIAFSLLLAPRVSGGSRCSLTTRNWLNIGQPGSFEEERRVSPKPG